MSLIWSIIVMVMLSGAIIFALYNILPDFWCINKKDLGRNHCAIVTFNSCGGNIHFDDMTQDELIEQLKLDIYPYNNLRY